ncbi:Nucleotidyltransferase [Clavulina sp. PMI_390]|nr:Nucleotidyltransferase [Clavulina sp. PMI_390]
MHDMYESLPDIDAKWRQFATRKAISAIRNCKHPIKSIKDMQNIRGVGAKTQKKILDFLKTKKITLLENLKNDPQLRTIMEFKGIYGVGSQTAKEWWNRGLRTLDDVRSRKDGVNLNENQELGLRYYDDINARMPREEAKEIFEQVKAEALELDPKLLIEAMGSYRRGKKDCGDLDILISRPTNDGRDHEGLLDDLLMVLHQKKIILHDLALPKPTDRLESKYMGLAASTDPNHKVRRLDILTIPCHQWGAALLYFTGDDIFNRSMRLLARKQGYSLNQRGLFAGVVRNSKGIKLNNGTIICSATEREIFDKLGVPWQEPHERKRG